MWGRGHLQREAWEGVPENGEPEAEVQAEGDEDSLEGMVECEDCLGKSVHSQLAWDAFYGDENSIRDTICIGRRCKRRMVFDKKFEEDLNNEKDEDIHMKNNREASEDLNKNSSQEQEEDPHLS